MLCMAGIGQGKASRRRNGGQNDILNSSDVCSQAQGVSMEEAEKQPGKWKI